MGKKCLVSTRTTITTFVVFALVLCVTGTVYAYRGGPHRWAGEQSTVLFRQGLDDPRMIERHPSFPMYPELIDQSFAWDPISSYDPGDPEDKTWSFNNWEWIMWCSEQADIACVATLNHFWCVADGLDDCPGGYDAYNSWEISQGLWIAAVDAWHAGDLGWAYTNLGYTMHHVQDLLQPAHANDDLHVNHDSIEEWFSEDYARQMYSWDGSSGNEPSNEIPWPNASAQDNSQLLQDIQNVYCWDGCGDSSCGEIVSEELDQWQGAWLKSINPHYNMQKYFYLLYWADQFGNWFASDDMDGNDYDPVGWMKGYPGFPTRFANIDEDGNPVSIHSWVGLEDNDEDCGGCTPRCQYEQCDADGDLTLITTWCYGAMFKASPALIDLFRRTVDHEAPVTTVELTRSDGETVKAEGEWNNWPVTVKLTHAEDRANDASSRASGLWKIWGLCDSSPPDDYVNPSWGISTDGKHLIECMSVDKCGNVEDNNDVAVWLDTTPPEVVFPDLKSNYLTSESVTATWEATDVTSGIASELAYLDGQPLTKGQVLNLALLGGKHKLEVYASDNASNMRYATYEFEVWIDATTHADAVLLNKRTNPRQMTIIVGLPAAYDAEMIDLSTCRLSVKGTLDLTQSDPVVGETAVIEGKLLTDVADHDNDGVRDVRITFLKDPFVNALYGQTGDVISVVSGGLKPNGTPRFFGLVKTPVVPRQ